MVDVIARAAFRPESHWLGRQWHPITHASGYDGAMNGSRSPASFLRVSLWELFLVLGLVAVGCASLKYAGEVWWIVLSSVMLAGFLAAAVAAVVGRGAMQARAIGFVLCVAIYLLLVFWSAPFNDDGTTSREFDPATAHLPTTRLLLPLHAALSTQIWIDASTGRPMPNFDPHSGIGLNVHSVDSVNRVHFMAIGHLLWAFLLGYLGSRLAVWMDACRRSDAATN
jgi:hypothetical protein